MTDLFERSTCAYGIPLSAAASLATGHPPHVRSTRAEIGAWILKK